MNKVEYYYRIGGIKFILSRACNSILHREQTISDYDLFCKANTNMYPKLLKAVYEQRTGEKLNLDNPQSFNEKIQWLKIYDSTPLKTQLVDKYLVRDWIKGKIGEEYLIPLLGVWNSFDEIDFDMLPQQFVLKCNHGSGWTVVVTEKTVSIRMMQNDNSMNG